MAGKSGGAWKVAYADFVTAMMAFFLVMWICGQDQKIRSAVSYYFNDPFENTKIGTSKQPNRAGSVAEMNSTGTVIQAESAALGQGRKSHTPQTAKATPTKLIADWLLSNEKTLNHWRDQARQARAAAAASKEVQDRQVTADRAAVFQLAKRLRNELTPVIAADSKDLQQDLLFEIMHQVNWAEIAEDLLAR